MKDLFKNLKKYPLVIYFAIVLYGISIADLFSPVKTHSELENRDLATFPKFSWKQLFDNEYTPKIEDFTEDHFIVRDKWISLKSISESLLGKTENNGVVYGKDGYQFTKFVTTNYSQMEKNMGYINKFMERHSDRNVHFLLAPTAPGVMTDKDTADSPVINTDYILGYVAENIGGNALINVRDTLKQHTDEYIYYRTDHHWTTLGAYYGYEQLMNILGKDYTSIDNYKMIDVEDFLGTHYSKSKTYNVQADTLSYIDIEADIVINDVAASIYEKEKLDVRDKYAMFTRGNPGYATIKGNGEGKIMILKDSYANCMIPFMVADFGEIHIFDMRYITMGLDQFISEHDYDEILFLYNCETFLSDKDLVKINMFN